MEKQRTPRACCFTGHRPEKLGAGEGPVRAWLEKEIRRAAADGYTEFICGCARGVDLWAGSIVLALKKEIPGLRLTCAAPWPDCCRGWAAEWQAEYDSVIRRADRVVYIGERYSRGVYHARNKWMADRSARVIAVYTGAPGGTKRTVEYARALGREVVLYPSLPEADESGKMDGKEKAGEK